MAPRFFASPYKNALATPAKKEGWWAELPVASSAISDSADLIRASSDYWLAQGSSAGHLVCLPYESPSKFNNRPQTLHVTSKAISCFDVSRFDDFLAAATDDGRIVVHSLPLLSDFTAGEALSSSPLTTFSHPAGRADIISSHPTSSGLLLAVAKSTVGIYNVLSEGVEPIFTIEQSSPVWSAQWSLDGRLVSTTTKDGQLRTFDVRSGSASPAQEATAHQGLKCSRHVWLNNEQTFTTGFSRTRDREYSLFDGRNLGSAIKSQRLDTGTAALTPLADVERGIVYMAGKGDMTMRWVEVGGPATFTEGGTPLPFTIAGTALAPPSQLNLMKAEINRLIVLTTDAVVPVAVEVPRRQYIDFHSELFPPVAVRVPAQDAQNWLAGQNATVDLVAQDPQRKPSPAKRAPPPASAAAQSSSSPIVTPSTSTPPANLLPTPASVEPLVVDVSALSVTHEAPALSTAASPPSTTATATAKHQDVLAADDSKEATDSPSLAPLTPSPTTAVSAVPAIPTPKVDPAPVASPAPVLTASQAQPPSSAAPLKAAIPRTTATATSTFSQNDRFNPRWSRKFLTGRTPLKPDYHGLSGLSATMSADTQMLKATSQFFFFPLAGAGGRLGVHPIEAKGRFPTSIPSFICGATITDFETDPFNSRRVFVASDDSKIRVFVVPEGGLKSDSGDSVLVMSDAKMDRISELKHHPSAANLLLSVSDDHGKPSLRLWDLESGSLLKHIALPPGGVSSTAWSPDGTSLAIALKNKKLVVLDPRKPENLTMSPAHESIRPSRVAWLSSTHLVTTGFSRTANREVLLYRIANGALSHAGKQTLDVSPAPLFPFSDPDTSILLLYSRGDRSCFAYEVQPEDKTPFSVLPSFENGTLQSGFAFRPKAQMDIKAVEVLHGFRLTPTTIEIVSFTIPRARSEFFQDDVFVPTCDTETPTISAQDFVAGKDVPVNLIDLCPDGMIPLSQAPETAAVISTRNKIAQGPTLTDSQKADLFMDKIFAAAQVEDDDDEPPEPKTNRPQDDDDW